MHRGFLKREKLTDGGWGRRGRSPMFLAAGSLLLSTTDRPSKIFNRLNFGSHHQTPRQLFDVQISQNLTRLEPLVSRLPQMVKPDTKLRSNVVDLQEYMAVEKSTLEQ